MYPQGVTRTAMVTGASSGIGRAVALAFARAGYWTWAVARSLDRLEALREDAPAGRVRPVIADLTSAEAITNLVAQVGASHASLDVVVHAAGGISQGPLAAFPAGMFRDLLDTNVVAPYALTQRLLPHLHNGSTVVFLNSSQGRRASAGQSPFGATQHALRAVADALRAEVNARGIRVTSIYPGRTATPRQAALYAQRGDPYRPQDLLQAEDLAGIVLSVASLPPTAEVTELDIRPAIKSY